MNNTWHSHAFIKLVQMCTKREQYDTFFHSLWHGTKTDYSRGITPYVNANGFGCGYGHIYYQTVRSNAGYNCEWVAMERTTTRLYGVINPICLTLRESVWLLQQQFHIRLDYIVTDFH